MKTCTRCHQSKPECDFYADYRIKGGLRSTCKQCDKLVNAQYYTQHKAKIAQQHAAYREAHREDNREYQKQYRAIHKQELSAKKRKYYNQPEVKKAKCAYDKEYYKQHKEELLDNMKRWRQTAAGQASRTNSNTKRRVQIGDDAISAAEWKRIMSDANWQCVYCGAELTSANRSLDHVIPLSKNGSHCADNLVACCRRCNSSKKNKTLSDFLKRNRT